MAHGCFYLRYFHNRLHFYKILGAKKGIGLTGAVGGLISSTGVTSALSESSRKSKLYYTFAFGVIIAWAIMFLRVLFVTLVLNKDVFLASLPVLGSMAVAAILCVAYLYYQRTTQGLKAEQQLHSKARLPWALH